MADHNTKGIKGEELATLFLRKNGYTVLEVNWRFKNLEADIIAVMEGVMIVAEVKTRATNFYGDPETFVNKQKQRNLIKAANEYIRYKQLDLEVRFDIISVILGKVAEEATINHIQDAFLFHH